MIGVSLGSELDGFLQDHTRIHRVNSLKQVFGLLANDSSCEANALILK